MPLRQAVKRALVALASSREYALVHQGDLDYFLLTEHLHRQFALLEVGCVLDVGANRGQYRVLLRNRVNYEGRIISFEPVARLAESLREKAALEDPKWEIHAFALGAANEERKLNVMRADDFSSFLLPTDAAVKDRFATSNVVEHVEAVHVQRLDDVVAAGLRLGPGVVWLKLDTQGWDLEVLRGAAQTLPSIGGLQIELSVLPIYQGMPDYLTVLAELRLLGFGIVALVPVTRDALGHVIEFDCVATKLRA
jgi:FkbM family methyltransferase